jgi:hypothetical protein
VAYETRWDAGLLFAFLESTDGKMISSASRLCTSLDGVSDLRNGYSLSTGGVPAELKTAGEGTACDARHSCCASTSLFNQFNRLWVSGG